MVSLPCYTRQFHRCKHNIKLYELIASFSLVHKCPPKHMDATTLNDDDVINYSQAAGVFAACSAIMMLINSGAATNKTLRMLYCVLQHSLKLRCSLEDDGLSTKRVEPVNALPAFKCTNQACSGSGTLSDKAKVRRLRDPNFIPTTCTECHFKFFKATKTTDGPNFLPFSDGRSEPGPVVLQVSTPVPPKIPPAERKAAKTARRLAARQQQQQNRVAAGLKVAKRVTFEVTIDTTIESTSPEPLEPDNGSSSDDTSLEEHDEVDVGIEGEMPTLSACFEHLDHEEAPPEEGDEADESEDTGSAAEGEEAEESEDNGSAAEGDDSVGDNDGASSESSGPDTDEITTEGDREEEDKMFADNEILSNAILAMMETEADPTNGLDADDWDDEWDSYEDAIDKLRALISNFPPQGGLRELRDLHCRLGAMLQDNPRRDDLIEAKSVYLKAMELSTLIAKNKTIAASTVDGITGEPAESVLLFEGASAGAKDSMRERIDAPADSLADWSHTDDALLAAARIQFPRSGAHRWRNIAEMVPGKNAGECKSRARCPQ